MEKRGKICVSLAGADAAAVASAVRPVLDLVDVVEIRLDSMTNPEVKKCCALIPKPLLFTNRPTWEGGQFGGTEEERVAPLLTAIRARAAWVDLELRADGALRRSLLSAAAESGTEVISSWHDFSGTPSRERLNALLAQMMESGCHVGKIVTTAQNEADVLRVLALQEQALVDGFPLSCFCMGAAGRISRFATLYLGGYMTYGALDGSLATAPGQLTVRQLQTLTQVFEDINAD
ncbi:type I 3-dehydroquinate dehydratase [Desulfolithobacter sp.]